MNNLTKKIFQKVFGNKISININSDINNTYKWDSLNHIKLISEIEKVTKKKLNINQVIQLTSVRKIDSLLKKK
jgi:acyl carrier protein